MSPVPPPKDKPKARRTHARRSCNVCKVRKTRCELPDLGVPASSDPLPEDKSCHRCRVLSLPCVVNDSHMKSRRGQDGAGVSKDMQPKQEPQFWKSTDEGPSPASASDSQRPSKRRRTPVSVPKDNGPQPLRKDAVDFHGLRRVRLQGRPHFVTSSLLKLANGVRRPSHEVDLTIPPGQRVSHLVGAEMRRRLACAFDQVRTLHPHLQRLDDLFSMTEEREFDAALELLLATTLYVTIQSLPNTAETNSLREELVPHILKHEHFVLAKQTPCFYAIQALEVLTFHAPFSPALPYTPTDLRLLGPSRGLLGAALNISASVNFDNLVNSSRLERRDNPDFWLWLGIRATEAQMALEDVAPRKPALLAEARAGCDPLMLPENEQVWNSAGGIDDPSELLGKLTLCDRLARLDELHNTITRVRQILEIVTEIPNFPAAAAIENEIRSYRKLRAAIAQRHDRVIRTIYPTAELAATWTTYQALRTTWEEMKALEVAVQTLVALHFLPASAIALPNLPEMTTAKGLHYATTRANNVDDLLLAYSTNSVAAEHIRAFTEQRGVLAERQLRAYTGATTQIVPLHDTASLLVESAKCLLEQHAVRLSFWRLGNTASLVPPAWVATMHRVSGMLHAQSGNECVVRACSTLLASMAQLVTDAMAGVPTVAPLDIGIPRLLVAAPGVHHWMAHVPPPEPEWGMPEHRGPAMDSVLAELFGYFST